MDTSFHFGADASELQAVLTNISQQFAALGDTATQGGAALQAYGQGTIAAADQSRVLGDQMALADVRVQALTERMQKLRQESAQSGDADANAQILDRLRDQKAQEVAISESAANSMMAISRAGFAEKRAQIEASATFGEISDRERLVQLADITRQQDQLQIGYYDHLASLYQDDQAKLASVQQAKLLAQMTADTHAVQASQQAAQASISAWQQTFKPIDRAVNQSVTGIITGTKTAQQAIAGFAKSMVASGVAAAEGWLSRQIATQLAMTEVQRTQSAARSTLNAGESSGFLGRLGSMVSGWLGLETAKTAATTAETGTRSAEEGGAAAAAIAAAKAQAAGVIPTYAAEGAAAAMASVAAIPVTGWAMAPEVGAEHFETAMGWGAIATAAGGWDRVPYDGAMAELHKDEMVLPASIAEPLRSMTQAFPLYGLPPGLAAQPATPGAAGAAVAGRQTAKPFGDTHHHFSPTTHITVNNQGSGGLSPDQVGDAVQAALRNGHAGLVKQIRAMR